MIYFKHRVITLFLAAIFANAVLAACSTSGSAGTVSVLGPWTGEEQESFEKVLEPFTRDTGVKVVYQGTRALNEVLFSDVQNGTPPDIAILFSPGELGQYQRSGTLHPLDNVIGGQMGAYSRQWRTLLELGTTPPHLYGVAVKVNLKSLIWYNPKQVKAKPEIHTLDQLVTLGKTLTENGAAPWCVGMGSTPTSGWPGTDWIEDILLHQFGTDIYQKWASGTLLWTSQQVRQAWEEWGTITGMDTAGSRSALLTDWQDAGRPMFTNKPGCYLHHEPSFVMASYQNYRKKNALEPGIDFDFFRFPDFDASGGVFEVSADIASMFNDTPQARKLISYLATDEAQKIWPKRDGGAFSANRNVAQDAEAYQNNVSRGIADELTTAHTVCYDAADLMPATMRNAFYRAVLEYLSDPKQLDQILHKLEEVRQKGIAQPEQWLNIPCGQ